MASKKETKKTAHNKKQSFGIYNSLDKTVRKSVIELHKKNIPTNSSEGGGAPDHGAPDFSYIEAKLSSENLEICKKNHFLPNKIHHKRDEVDYLFNGSAHNYGQRTGYYIMGLNRSGILENEVQKRFHHVIRQFKKQL